jgi:hypothetical protein
LLEEEHEAVLAAVAIEVALDQIEGFHCSVSFSLAWTLSGLPPPLRREARRAAPTLRLVISAGAFGAKWNTWTVRAARSADFD